MPKATKEYALGEIFSKSWKIFTDNFNLIIIVGLIVYIPTTIIAFLISPEIASGSVASVRASDIPVYARLANMLISFVGALAIISVIHITREAVDGREVGIKQSFQFAVSRWMPFVGTQIIQVIFLIGLTLLLVIPGVIFFVFWAFTSYVVVLKGKFGLDALNYSKSIVRGRWWKVLGYVFVISLVVMGGVSIISILSTAILSLPSWLFQKEPNEVILLAIIRIIHETLLLFAFIASTVFFLNFEATKKESSLGDVSTKQITG